MNHIYINKKSPKTLIMLHGTGGDETQLLDIANMIDPSANILGIRGRINENGMNRYFKRIAMGIYDIENYKLETINLIDKIINFSISYNFDLKQSTIIGFSNGANIALGIIQINPIVDNYILYSPDFINPNDSFVNLDNINIFISSSKNDNFVDYENILKLVKILNDSLAKVKLVETTGHQLTEQVLIESINWYKNIE